MYKVTHIITTFNSKLLDALIIRHNLKHNHLTR